MDPGPAHGSGSDFGPGYPGPRPGSGRSRRGVGGCHHHVLWRGVGIRHHLEHGIGERHHHVLELGVGERHHHVLERWIANITKTHIFSKNSELHSET